MDSEQGAPVEERHKPDPTPKWTSTTPYNELQPGQIRLLQVEAKTSDSHRPLSCTLTVHNLDTAPRYTALSYTWGAPHRNINKLRTDTPSLSRQVKCNGKDGRVGENLYDFLAHCARDTVHDLSGYWWIDALAINQADIQERCEQVEIMSAIYQRATRVVVWLGPEDRHTKPAVELMHGLLQLERETRLSLHHTEVREGHSNRFLDSNNWQALAQFFQREWFNRAWIIQEVVLAQAVILICGSCSISWADMSLFSQFLATSSWTTLLKRTARQVGHTTTNIGHNTPARLAAAQKTWLSNHDDKFLHALIRARSSDSENARDKVYSQLGLGNADIIPDYRASVQDAYITAAKYILTNSKSLLLLTCVEGEDFQTIPGLPSWVPDWSVNKTLGLRGTGYTAFRAALDLPKQHELSTDKSGKHMLTIRATKLDNISEAGGTKPELRKSPSGLWRMLSKLDDGYATTGQSREEAVWRALVTNREEGGTPSKPINPRYPASPEPLGSSFRDWVLWRYVVTSTLPTATTFPVSSNLPTQEEIVQARDQSVLDASYLANLERRASLFDTHYSHASLIRPFSTELGYFGIGTQCLRKGDSVWIAPGSRIPLIFRAVEGSKRYRLVGGAYLHGFMNGEALGRGDVKFEMVSLE
ncbi:hypothetical protein HBH69_028440 [Parastagonospora nodorum]|nr:hypothetical protein HBH82_053090 [Parastagonospora nodorum]KAH4680476.1 hypothetical protein HBH78_136150 [Parastagonospora nodorum]KAH4712335.1 hypothetical protein HBH67_011550 [Parastagonospora nodorum]KAH4763700.1 hypothetical protein HBH63_191090 [Parastagonospora nodorum]KAH4787625.1 hypothetical protein HBH62_063700 [Parastagonospora nodorum]